MVVFFLLLLSNVASRVFFSRVFYFLYRADEANHRVVNHTFADMHKEFKEDAVRRFFMRLAKMLPISDDSSLFAGSGLSSESISRVQSNLYSTVQYSTVLCLVTLLFLQYQVSYIWRRLVNWT